MNSMVTGMYCLLLWVSFEFGMTPVYTGTGQVAGVSETLIIIFVIQLWSEI
jgi:hypothetical protein